MSNSSFQYIFRFCCDPGFNDKQEIDALLRYADEALIDDVAVFANVEEINTGHMSFEEQDAYLNMMRVLQPLLAKKGITMSVNQWHSVMHADLGKTLHPDQSFRKMVDIEGNEATLCVCPLCKEWQNYIAQIYARYAELNPSILWVEDDFRLHNHEPLKWGGCFCEEHMRLYSERAGKKLTREEFLEGVLKLGTPHPYRQIWLDVSKETMLSAARAIVAGVRKISSTVKIGLMSSAPFIHAAEGRDWHLLLHTLSDGCTPVDRVHLPGYQENSPSQYLHGFNMVSMLTAAFLPNDCEIYPELENFPFSLFSKSRAFTRFQLLSALPLHLHGITIDLFDLNGNGIIEDEHYQDMLRETKQYLNKLTDLGVFGGERVGVKVLINARSSYTLHTENGKQMEELYPKETFFAGLLPAFGIPYAYTDDIDMKGQIVAASGQVLRNWNEEELRKLFADNTVLLNGDAAWTLVDMGLGDLAGIQDAHWVKQNSGICAYEQATNGGIYCGRENARASAMISFMDTLNITYMENADVQEYTAMFDSFRHRTVCGQTMVDGHVLIYPFGREESHMTLPPMAFNRMRQEVLQDMLCHAGVGFPMVKGLPYMEPYCFEHQNSQWIYLVNGSSDDAAKIQLVLPDGSCADKADVWPSFGIYTIVPCIKEADCINLVLAIPPMESALLRIN